MILTGAIFMMIYLDMSLSVIFKHENVTLTLYKEHVIASPGYPNKKYEQDTIYTWDVTAPATTEKIFINVKMNIHEFAGSCEDYLKIQEINPSTGNFTVLKKCGTLTDNRIARGNRLLIKLVSNYDELTSSGFQLKLKVLEVGSTFTSRTVSTPSTTAMPSKTRTTESTVKTTDENRSESTSTTRINLKSTQMPLTAVPLKTTSTTKVLTSLITTTATKNTSTQQSTSTTPLTTRMTITTAPIELTTSSTQIASTLKRTDKNTSKKEITTLRSSSFQSVVTRKTSDQTTTQTQRNQSSPLETINITQLMETDNDTASFWRSMKKETVILLIGLGVLEVTLIIVGVLVQRYRRKRKYYPSRHACKRNDDHTNTLKRQNSCGETHVYDEIDIDNVKEEEEESQYKELPEGVYDTTLKRRSNVKVVGERKSYYSRGSIINMFRTSSFFRRKVNETSLMTFSSFKGPIQSQVGEKK